MSDWSLKDVLADLHRDVQERLEKIRRSLHHPVSKGDASEKVWNQLFNTYLPARYVSGNAFVVDSDGKVSEQIDVLIYDRQYSPFIFNFEGQKYVPAESVYAVFEAKQSLNRTHVGYAQGKVKSVRQMHRTSLPIKHAGGKYDPKEPPWIYGGVLTFESDWKPALGESLLDALAIDQAEGKLDLGCVAAHGYFSLEGKPERYEAYPGRKSATGFLFELISRLQESGTVPMIDIKAYGKWLED